MKASNLLGLPLVAAILATIFSPPPVHAAVTAVAKGFGETAHCAANTAINQVCTSAGSEDCGFASDKGHILQCDDEGENKFILFLSCLTCTNNMFDALSPSPFRNDPKSTYSMKTPRPTEETKALGLGHFVARMRSRQPFVQAEEQRTVVPTRTRFFAPG